MGHAEESTASPSQATGHQLDVEAVNAAAHFGNTTAAANRDAQYVIISPHGTDPDGWLQNGFCAWHDYHGHSTLSGGPVTSPYGDIAFTNLPYITDAGASCGEDFVSSGGTLDGVSIVEGHEYTETITDQNPAGGWTDGTVGTRSACRSRPLTRPPARPSPTAPLACRLACRSTPPPASSPARRPRRAPPASR